MADAEKKNISKLDFNISDAINSLETVNQKLEQISKSSENYAKKIGDNLSKGLNIANIIDTKSINTNLNNINLLSKNKSEALSAQLIKIKAKEQSNINEIVTKGEQQRQTAAYKSALKQEEYNNKVLKSTQTLYDKITEYAKTYVIYQGFNELRQAVTQTIDEMIEIENQMVAIDRVMNESGFSIDDYRDKLINLAYEYGNAFDNVADITLRLAQAGFDSQEALKLTEKTLLALNTAELNATEATDDMVAIMAQWGLMTGTATEKAKAYGDIIDKINKVADKYPTTSADILDALKKTSSAFNLAGASIDETIATITAAEVASQRGGKAIGTALSNITQQLKDEGKINIAESLGIDFYTDETKTEFKDIMDIFGELANKMQEFKNAGKENSQEMQDLLSVFTVFRRNIGASLLGEMSGEDSTYLKVLNDSLTATGYSIQENEKYMKTAKAAQAQFNDELLRLKTKVWDSGLEDVFRDMLKYGADLINGIGNIIDKFGLLPTVIGTVTLAFTALNTKTQLFAFNSEKNAIQLNGLAKKIAEATIQVKETNKVFTEMKDGQIALTSVQENSIKTFGKNAIATGKYAASLVTATAKTFLLQAATIALNVAISAGLSLAITTLITKIDDWVHKQENVIKANEEVISKSREAANELSNQAQTLEDLTSQYEELSKEVGTDGQKLIDSNNISKAYELQEQINELIKESGNQVELVISKTDEQGKVVQNINSEYEKQINLIKQATYEKQKQRVEELKSAAYAAQNNLQGYETNVLNVFENFNWSKINTELQKANIDLSEYAKNLNAYSNGFQKYFDALISSKGGIDLDAILDKADIYEQLNILTDLQGKLEETGLTGTEAYGKISEILTELTGRYDEAEQAVSEYEDALSELYAMLGQIDNYNTFLDQIYASYESEAPRKLIEELKAINKEFSDGQINIEDYFNKIQEKINSIDLSTTGEDLEAYQAIFAATTQSLAEGIESLQAGLDSGNISFSEYSNGIKEAAENSLELYTRQNELNLDNGIWKDATGNINEYANSLQNATNELSNLSPLLQTIGDNYDYIAQNADSAGQAAFTAADISSQSYQNLATQVTNSLNQIRDNNSNAFNAIVNDVANSMGQSTNEILNANGYINEGLFNNSDALNSALNSSAKQTGESVKNVTSAMGKVISALGDAISNFDYSLVGSLDGLSYKEIDVFGNKISVPNGLKFKITGSGGSSIQNLSSALNQFGSSLGSLGTQSFTYKPKTLGTYTPSTTNTPTSSTTLSPGSSGKSSSNDTSASDAEKAAEEAKKAEEEAYKKRLEAFKDYIDEKERLEQRWVDKQDELGQLSTEDFLYITQQRIERYKKYLDEVKKATWMNTEDRLELEKEYSEEIEDLQVDYIGYLRDQLDEEIEALEEANDKKIELIEQEADKRIEALKKVEDENDRIRTKEEYEKNRQEHLNDISYWEQRTGREAQEALQEAKKNLQELDEEWQDQLEDWSIEDQIAAIEEERDAQIEAIQKTQEEQIASWEAAYDAKVKMFAETGQIIYDNSVIQSQALYNAYKQNFIDPIANDLANLNKVTTPAPAPTPTQTTTTPTQQYETYTIKYGDTLSRIAQKFGTTIEKIMAANPYVTNKNKIYAGKTLQIPKFHEGGIVGGNQEAFALLKPNEVILKPEWAEGINKLAKMAKSGSNQISTNSTVVEVKGDLVRIEANIKDKTDAEYLTRKIEKTLENKFNIKK